MINKPKPEEHPPYYAHYIGLVKSEDVIDELLKEQINTYELITSLDEETLMTPYEEGKWTIKEIIAHLIDTERIFNYRAMRFARFDRTELPGFNQNDYVKLSNANLRDINDLMQEYAVVRASSIQLYRSFNEAMLMNIGKSNGAEVSVRAIIYMTLGHEIHHRNVIESKYLGR